jgi:hypothetical protein
MHPRFMQTNLRAKMETKAKAKMGACKSCPTSSSSSSSKPSTSSSCKCIPGPGSPHHFKPSSTNSSDCPDPTESSSPSSSSSSSSSSSGGKGTLTCTDPMSTNATGKLVEDKWTITKAPYKLERCDQVLLIEGATIPSYNAKLPEKKDYAHRLNNFFTLSAYMINSFTGRNGKTINGHILLEDLKDIPSKIYGAPLCLVFNVKQSPGMFQQKPMVMCMNSPEEVTQIIEVYMDFLKCRIGDNLKNVDPTALHLIFENACMGMGPPNEHGGDSSKIGAFLNPLLPKPTRTISNGTEKYNPYYDSKTAPGGHMNTGASEESSFDRIKGSIAKAFQERSSSSQSSSSSSSSSSWSSTTTSTTTSSSSSTSSA